MRVLVLISPYFMTQSYVKIFSEHLTFLLFYNHASLVKSLSWFTNFLRLSKDIIFNCCNVYSSFGRIQW